MLKIHDPASESPVEKLEVPQRRKRKRVASVRRGWWTVVGRGPDLKGHRWMFKAGKLDEAQKIGCRICREHKMDFIGVFAGHMAALRYARGESPRERMA